MLYISLLRKFLVVLLLAVASIACSSNVADTQTFSGSTMGTSYSVKIVPGNRAFDLARLKAGAQDLLDNIDALMSTYKTDSELSRFNRHEVNKRFVLSGQTYRVIENAQHISETTGGTFDVTVGPLVELWGFGAGRSIIDPPDAELIAEAIERRGYESLELFQDSFSILKRKNLRLDLSAIAKGYAVDELARWLEEQGVQNYLVEVGGETRAKGLNSRGLVWRLGIEKPDLGARTAVEVVEVPDMALATSGDYRNYFVSNDKRYSHTISPHTGYPVDHNLASVSVLAESCMEADALATALLVMGEEKGYNFAQENNLKAYFIYRDKGEFKVRQTDGFKPYVM